MSVPLAINLGVEQGDEREERRDWRIREVDEDDEEYWEVEDDEQQDKLARRKDVYEEEKEEDDDDDDDDEEGGDTYEAFSRNGWEAVHEQPWAQPSPGNDRVWVLVSLADCETADNVSGILLQTSRILNKFPRHRHRQRSRRTRHPHRLHYRPPLRRATPLWRYTNPL
jgi:hypothetical protein